MLCFVGKRNRLQTENVIAKQQLLHQRSFPFSQEIAETLKAWIAYTNIYCIKKKQSCFFIILKLLFLSYILNCSSLYQIEQCLEIISVLFFIRVFQLVHALTWYSIRVKYFKESNLKQSKNCFQPVMQLLIKAELVTFQTKI